LDAAELMNVGWNYKREHLHPLKESHSIFTDAGDHLKLFLPKHLFGIILETLPMMES
jgi:hypothetical protein